MDASIIIALITSAATIATVIISSISSASKTKYQVEMLADEIKELSQRVERHNGFDRRIVALETQVAMIMDDDHR